MSRLRSLLVSWSSFEGLGVGADLLSTMLTTYDVALMSDFHSTFKLYWQLRKCFPYNLCCTVQTWLVGGGAGMDGISSL